MGQIYLQDTGYIKPTNAGTQASSANMANSGSAVPLKTAEFIPVLKRNISDEPELSTNTPSEVNLGSLENMKFDLRCLINMREDTDTALVQHLLDMVATDGYKLMWYQYTTASTEENNGQLIYRVALNSKFGDQLTNGEKTAFTISDNFYTLHVLFFDMQIQQSGKKGFYYYTLKGIVLPVEDSTI